MRTQTTETDCITRSDLEDLGGVPVVVNLGCGEDDTGVGIDIHYDPDIMHDLNDGIPLADDSADVLLANHLIEHLDNPSLLFREARRVLRSSGEFRLEIPNVGWLPVRLWASQDLHNFWRHKDPDAEGHWLARRLGNDDEKRTKHTTLWSKALLEQHLDDAGFEHEIDGRHWSRNLSAVARPPGGQDTGQTLHELEREAESDLATGDYWARTRSKIMSRWVSERDPDSVLDIGCGSGYLTAEIARADTSADVIGIDHNPESIDVAQSRSSPARFEVADAFDLPYDRKFDCIIFGDVLEHFEDPEELLQAAHDVLASDGSVIISVPAFRALFGPHDEHNDHHERYSRSRLEDVAERAGLRLTRSTYTNLVPLIPYFVYQRLLRKPVPDSARGGHSGLLERVKDWLIEAESRNPLPLGITLLAEVQPDE